MTTEIKTYQRMEPMSDAQLAYLQNSMSVPMIQGQGVAQTVKRWIGYIDDIQARHARLIKDVQAAENSGNRVAEIVKRERIANIKAESVAGLRDVFYQVTYDEPVVVNAAADINEYFNWQNPVLENAISFLNLAGAIPESAGQKIVDELEMPAELLYMAELFKREGMARSQAAAIAKAAANTIPDVVAKPLENVCYIVPNSWTANPYAEIVEERKLDGLRETLSRLLDMYATVEAGK
jgi:hypothetical protein